MLREGDSNDQAISQCLIEFYDQQSAVGPAKETQKTLEVHGTEKEKLEELYRQKDALAVEMVFYIPIVRLDFGKYLIGTKEKQISRVNNANNQ